VLAHGVAGDFARLLRDLPEIEAKLRDGRLNLSHLTLAQNYFRRERKAGRVPSIAQKLELVNALEGKSTREAERVISQRTGLESPKRAMRIEPTEIQRKLFERVRDLWAHKIPSGDWTEIFVAMAEVTLTQIDPLKKAQRAESRAVRKRDVQKTAAQQSGNNTAFANTTAASNGGEPRSERLENGEVQFCLPLPVPLELAYKPERSRYVTAEVVHEAWGKSEGRCTYVGPDGMRCTSTYALQLDHAVPFACGGDSSADNIRLTCREHNIQRAREVYGREFMATFER
jgi:5-methylcytosine-specific restriction endonuclease McrA